MSQPSSAAGTVAVVDFTTYRQSVHDAMDQAGGAALIRDQERILVKPNLLNLSGPPTTTDWRCVHAVVAYCRQHASEEEVLVVEGSGGADTDECYRKHGYRQIAEDFDVPLVDLDKDETVELSDERAGLYKTIRLPRTILEGFLISVPVLKDHSMTLVTLSLKNLIGILPERYYSGYWSYKKSMVHKDDVEQAVADISLYRPIDFCVIDAAIGQCQSHITGQPCDPPVGKIVAGRDPLEVDKVGADLLGHAWQDVEHLALVDEARQGR